MEIEQLSNFFKIFSDSTRLKIIVLLLNNELSVSEITNQLNLSQSTVSHQLAILRANAVVKVRCEKTTKYYSLDDHHIEDLILIAKEHLEEIR